MMVCGNAATRMETFIVKGGVFAYGSYTEIDELFDQQTAETDAANAKRFCIGW
jgi:peptide/nickel transport system substrate-binding protein